MFELIIILSTCIVCTVVVTLVVRHFIKSSMAELESTVCEHIGRVKAPAYKTEAGMKWLLQQQGMEVVEVMYGHPYSVQPICANCRRASHTSLDGRSVCDTCPTRRLRDGISYTPSDVGRILSAMDQYADRIVEGVRRNDKDFADAIALALHVQKTKTKK